MLRSLYDRLMRLAAGKHAEGWMAAVSFAESSFFPLPPDILLLPMCVAKPERAWRYAFICTVASVLGGILGYAIGYYLVDLGHFLLSLSGHSGGLEEFQRWYDQFGLWIILAKGVTPIPYKLVTIASGLAHFSFPMFIIASVITRGARFYLSAALLKKYGEPVREMVEKRLALATAAVVGLLVVGVFAVKLL